MNANLWVSGPLPFVTKITFCQTPPPPFVMRSHFLLDGWVLKELISVMSTSYQNVPYYLSSVEIVQTK